MSKKVVIVDYGLGNIRSAQKSIEKAFELNGQTNYSVEKSSNYKSLIKSSHIVLPGQGAFQSCIEGLIKLDGVIEEIHNQVLIRKKPILGICVGMQLFATKGYENGEHKGLDLIDGEGLKIPPNGHALPHMGWNKIRDLIKHPLLLGASNEHFYFVHSYYFKPNDKKNILATTNYNFEFPSVVGKGNIYGTQFHPEKSSKAGIKILSNFLLS